MWVHIGNMAGNERRERDWEWQGEEILWFFNSSATRTPYSTLSWSVFVQQKPFEHYRESIKYNLTHADTLYVQGLKEAHTWPECRVCIYTTVYLLYKHAHCTLMHTHKHASSCLHTHTLVSFHRAPVKVAGHINNMSWCKQASCCISFWVLGAVKFQNEVEVSNWSETWQKHISGFQHYIQVSLEEKLNTVHDAQSGQSQTILSPHLWYWSVRDCDWFREGFCQLRSCL